MDPRSQEFAEQIGTILIQRGLLDETALLRARKALEESNERFDHILTRLGLLQENKLIEILSDYLKLKVISKEDYPDTPILPEELESKFLKNSRLLPIENKSNSLVIAMADPFNHEAIEAISYLVDKNIECCLTLNADFEAAMNRLYQDEDKQKALSNGADFGTEDDVERLRDIASEAPVIQLVNQIITQAVEQGASDIHIEPLENNIRVRYRIDGVLIETQSLPSAMQSAVTSRIKILGRLNIAERRMPQDGRIKIAIRGQDIDIRLSTTPTYYGESVVMRILDQGALTLDFEALGFYGQAYENYKKLLSQPNGIILVTGPTGSGKTTTLYTSLNDLNNEHLKIFTVEDPIEYQLAGINQLQVQPKVGLSFAAALRSILRQDPDIIMIGEIRDLETAQIAIQSSLTGHMVLSTLHTNSAAATVTRLLDMGVEDYLLSSTVKGIMAQRLVRTLCNECAEVLPVSDAFLDKLEPSAQTLAYVEASGGMRLRKARGCSSCNHTGFQGRTTIMELFIMSEELQEIILKSGSQISIEHSAINAGMQTLYQDGLTKALLGITTIEEVLQLTQAS